MSGNVWMFSDEIDDEDLEFMSHDYVTYNMACEYYRLGIKPVVRMAHEAGAVYKIGKKVLIRRSIFEAYKKEISIRELDEKAKEQGISGRTMRDVRSRMKNELEYRVNEKQENSIRLKE